MTIASKRTKLLITFYFGGGYLFVYLTCEIRNNRNFLCSMDSYMYVCVNKRIQIWNVTN